MKVECGQDIAQPQIVPENPPLTNVPQTKINQNGKRGVTYTDDIIYLYDDIEADLPSLPPRKRRNVNVKMSLENATEYCRKSLLSTKAAQVCLELSNVNISSAITQCAADLQVNFTGTNFVFFGCLKIKTKHSLQTLITLNALVPNIFSAQQVFFRPSKCRGARSSPLAMRDKV